MQRSTRPLLAISAGSEKTTLLCIFGETSAAVRVLSGERQTKLKILCLRGSTAAYIADEVY